MAIRYDYGLDFWSYYNGFNNEERRTSATEPLFWMFCALFSKYYQLIAATSILLMASVYFWVRKFVSPQFYALFFMCFMCIPGQSFAMMTAIRSDMAFAVLTWGLYNYYVKKTNIYLYVFSVVAATLFHNSAVIFIIVPIFGRLISKINPYAIFSTLIVFSIFSFTGITQDISTYIFKQLYGFGIFDADYYSVYATKYVSNINGAIMRSALLFPTFFICRHAAKSKDVFFQQFYVLTIFYMIIYTLSLDLEYRFTLYLFIYFVIAIASCLPKMNTLQKLISVVPMVALCVFQLYGYFNLMRAEMFGEYSEGNFFIYSTIFDNLPLI